MRTCEDLHGRQEIALRITNILPLSCLSQSAPIVTVLLPTDTVYRASATAVSSNNRPLHWPRLFFLPCMHNAQSYANRFLSKHFLSQYVPAVHAILPYRHCIQLTIPLRLYSLSYTTNDAPILYTSPEFPPLSTRGINISFPYVHYGNRPTFNFGGRLLGYLCGIDIPLLFHWCTPFYAMTTKYGCNNPT